MIPELAAYHASIASRLQQVVACLDGLTGAQLNFRPPIDGANSVHVLASHTLGNARAWALGIACGRPIARDRAAEFRASGSGAARLREEASTLIRELEQAFAARTSDDLDRRLVPAKELWGENDPHEISVRDALLHVIEHASLHLGHLHVTRGLALASA
jgi:uncharacterized damage-inducible protein DinB